MNRQEKLIWAAGLFDGEGHVSISSAPNYMLRIAVEMTHEAAVLAFHSIVGCGGVSTRQRGTRNKRTWTFSVQGAAASNFASLIYPYSIVKRLQLRLAIEYGEECIYDLEYDGNKRLEMPIEVLAMRQIIKEELELLNKRGT